MNTRVAHRIADLISKPDGHRWDFIDGPLDGSFAGIRDDGKVVICWQGENYTLMPMTLRTRIHNWLIGIGNRKP